MVKLKPIFSLSILGISAFVRFPAFAHQEHLRSAITHTREAVAAGRANKPSILVRHSTEALHYAREAQADHPNVHIKKEFTASKKL